MERSSAVQRACGVQTRSETVSPVPRLLVKRRAAREHAITIPESVEALEVIGDSDLDSELSTPYVGQPISARVPL